MSECKTSKHLLLELLPLSELTSFPLNEFGARFVNDFFALVAHPGHAQIRPQIAHLCTCTHIGEQSKYKSKYKSSIREQHKYKRNICIKSSISIRASIRATKVKEQV